MSKLMQIDHADRTLAIARRPVRSRDTIDSAAVAVLKVWDFEPVKPLDHIMLEGARPVVRRAKIINAESRREITARPKGFAIYDPKLPNIQQAKMKQGREGAWPSFPAFLKKIEAAATRAPGRRVHAIFENDRLDKFWTDPQEAR